jgi:PadR family transcriptional regulator, regulatory protein PadR
LDAVEKLSLLGTATDVPQWPPSLVAAAMRRNFLDNGDFVSIMEQMPRPNDTLSNFELMVMLAIIRLGDEAYGVPIAEEIEKRRGKLTRIGSVYAALDRLAAKGFVGSELGEATAERGGRAKKYFRITGKGLAEVRETRRALLELWNRLPELR